MALSHKTKRPAWNPVKKPGSETLRAKKAGRSLHAQALHDEHSPDPKIRGKGIFALNAQAGKFQHRTGPKKSSIRYSRSHSRSRART